MNDFQESMKYHGFDPEVTYSALYQCSTVFSSKVKDIAYMIMLCCERGNNLESILAKSSKKGVEILTKLISTYKLVKRPTQANSLTLSRVALTFSWATCEYMLHCQNRTVPTMMLDSYVKDYPAVMCTSAFASIIPTTVSKECSQEILRAFMLHQLLFTEVVRPKQPLTAADITSCYNFAIAGVRNKFVPEDKRINFCHKWGILISESKDSLPTLVVQTSSKAYDSFTAKLK